MSHFLCFVWRWMVWGCGIECEWIDNLLFFMNSDFCSVDIVRVNRVIFKSSVTSDRQWASESQSATHFPISRGKRAIMLEYQIMRMTNHHLWMKCVECVQRWHWSNDGMHLVLVLSLVGSYRFCLWLPSDPLLQIRVDLHFFIRRAHCVQSVQRVSFGGHANNASECLKCTEWLPLQSILEQWVKTYPCAQCEELNAY